MANDATHYVRYRRVLAAIVAHPCFTLSEIKADCDTERPAFVTNVVRQLEADGRVEQADSKGRAECLWCSDRESFSADQWIDSKLRGNRITVLHSLIVRANDCWRLAPRTGAVSLKEIGS